MSKQADVKQQDLELTEPENTDEELILQPREFSLRELDSLIHCVEYDLKRAEWSPEERASMEEQRRFLYRELRSKPRKTWPEDRTILSPKAPVPPIVFRKKRKPSDRR